MSEYCWQETITMYPYPVGISTSPYRAWRLFYKQDTYGVAVVYETVGGEGLKFRGVGVNCNMQKAPEGINTIDELKQYVQTLHRMGEL